MVSMQSDIYLKNSLDLLPRVLGLLDRAPYSKTFGCFDRTYWLHRRSSYPSAIKQMGTHSLAIAYSANIDGNRYYQNPQMLEWIYASVKYWIEIQHKDGSFDEFYPNERGWAGPTGFLLHAMLDTRKLVGKFPDELEKSFKKAVDKAAIFLSTHYEKSVLGNHYAIAMLPLYEAYTYLNDEKILRGYEQLTNEFFEYCNEEGWTLEYDGADIAYQTGTISFLARLYKLNKCERIYNFLYKSIEFVSYAIPIEGQIGGVLGSRHTIHYYPYGFEYFAKVNPLAKYIAAHCKNLLESDNLTPSRNQEDHYLLYRVPEFFESYLIQQDKNHSQVKLPVFDMNGRKYFQHSGLNYIGHEKLYVMMNIKRGLTIKAFNKVTKKEILSDGGVIGRFKGGKVFSTQFTNDFEHMIEEDKVSVEGPCHYVSQQLFTPVKKIFFYLFMMSFGRTPRSALFIKHLIRKILIANKNKAPIHFKRELLVNEDYLKCKITLKKITKKQVSRVWYGGDLYTKYVPQSRYFNYTDLNNGLRVLSKKELNQLNTTGEIVFGYEIGR